MIGVRAEQLRGARVIALAPAQDHPGAVIAAARAGFVDDLVLSEELAHRVQGALDCESKISFERFQMLLCGDVATMWA